jgi:hypothetical protein
MSQTSWQIAEDHFINDIMPRLERLGKEIGAASPTNPVAKKIINYYIMLQRSFDPMTMVFLEKALDKYEESKSV